MEAAKKEIDALTTDVRQLAGTLKDTQYKWVVLVHDGGPVDDD